MRQPDFGTATLFLMTAFVMLFVGGARITHLFIDARRRRARAARVRLFEPVPARTLHRVFHPWQDPQGRGYHILQSLYALGSGGLFGVGLGQSRQKFGYLPEQYTDFIFSVIGEELGLIGAVAVLALFLLLAYRGLRIAMKAEDRFGFFLAVGITARSRSRRSSISASSRRRGR